MSWTLDAELHLVAMGLADTIKTGNFHGPVIAKLRNPHMKRARNRKMSPRRGHQINVLNAVYDRALVKNMSYTETSRGIIPSLHEGK